LADAPASWILLIHQLPPRPAYFRVKTWRQLQSLGAVALKNTVYALAELVHDVDLKDGKFKRPETAGFDRAILGVTRMHARDEDCLEAGSGLLDAFRAGFTR
jgi:hypothetical protein